MRLHLGIIGSCLLFMAGFSVQSACAAPLDVSDSAVAVFLASPFQYDYTSITDDASLRRFIDALDHQVAMIEYRQGREFVRQSDSTGMAQPHGRELENRYLQILGDNFIYKKLTDWKTKTADSACRAFIDLFLDRRNDFMADPTLQKEARGLSQRITDRLYTFRLAADGIVYDAQQAASILSSGSDLALCRKLYSALNDSVAALAPLASDLYTLYSRMGQQLGYRTSMDYHLSRLSFRKPEWLKIADELKEATEAEYQLCLTWIREESGGEKLAQFEIDNRLRQTAVLPDQYFPPRRTDSVLTRLLDGLGLADLTGKLKVREFDSAGNPALAIRLYPPDDVLFFKTMQGGYLRYRRQAAEFGRALPWAYADSALPYLLREYPKGSEEMLTLLFESMALDSQFLAGNFNVPGDELAKFEQKSRWLAVFRIRQVLVYFYFDYYLSDGQASDPISLFKKLETSLLGVDASSYQWIESLVSGKIGDYPERLAHHFCQVKTIEMLYQRFGEDYAANAGSGEFLKEKFCRPGRSRTIEQYITGNASDRLSVNDIRRQLHLH